MQLTHYTSKFESKQFPITLVCDNVTNAPNIGSSVQNCGCFWHCESLILCGESIPMGRKMMKTSRATENYVTYEIHDNASEIVKTLKDANHQIIALEVTENSLPIHQYQFNIEKPIALVIGDENFGVSDLILKLSDTIIHIEMFGQNSSMNVVQATNIALYEMTKQLL